MKLHLFWGFLAIFSSEGTAVKKPATNNCRERDTCVCHGTVHYARKYQNGKPGNGLLMTTSLLLEANNHLSKEVNGPYWCSSSAFRHDPAPGYHKHCTCIPAEQLAPPLCAPTSPHPPHSLRVAVGFYGVSQNLRVTLPTFQRHIFDVLQRHDVLFDVFSSTVLMDETSSRRQSSRDFESDEYDIRLLRPCAVTLTPVQSLLPTSKHADTSEVVLRHTRQSLLDMLQVFSRVHGVQYDALLALRPDTAVTTDAEVAAMLRTGIFSPTHLYIPSVFDRENRAAFGSPAVMESYLCSVGRVVGREYVVTTGQPSGAGTACGGVTLPASLPVKISRMNVIGVKRDRRLPSYDMLPRPAALDRRLCSASEGAAGGKSSSPAARVAIGFYGLSRNLRLTLPTFKKHVFEVLDRHHIAFDVFWATVTAPVLESNRSNEWNLDMDEYDVRRMRPCVTTLLPMYQVLNQTQFDFSHVSPHYHYKDGFSSVRNIFCSLQTQKVLDSSIRTYAGANNVVYDAIATFRPDTAVVRDIDLASLLTSRKFSAKHIYLPNFAHFKGVNDRSAYGSPAVMSAYLNRLEAFKASLSTNTDKWIYNTETFLKNYLKDLHIPVRKSTVRVMRVRADGKIPAYDSDDVVMFMSKKEIERCQMTLTNESTGKSFTALDTTAC